MKIAKFKHIYCELFFPVKAGKQDETNSRNKMLIAVQYKTDRFLFNHMKEK